MSENMQAKQVKNARILAFVYKHSTPELFDKLKELYAKDSVNVVSRISKIHYILTVLRDRIANGLLTQSEFDSVVGPIRLKW